MRSSLFRTHHYILFFVFSDASSKREASQALLQMAVYLANTFYLTSDSIVPMTRNTDLGDENIRDRNLIIVGDISFTKSYLEKVPLKVQEDQSVSLGKPELP